MLLRQSSPQGTDLYFHLHFPRVETSLVRVQHLCLAWPFNQHQSNASAPSDGIAGGYRVCDIVLGTAGVITDNGMALTKITQAVYL